MNYFEQILQFFLLQAFSYIKAGKTQVIMMAAFNALQLLILILYHAFLQHLLDLTLCCFFNKVIIFQVRFFFLCHEKVIDLTFFAVAYFLYVHKKNCASTLQLFPIKSLLKKFN